MPGDVGNVMLEILDGIQAGITSLPDRVDELTARVGRLSDDLGRWLNASEAAVHEDRHQVAGMLMMMRAAAGDFDARVAEIDDCMAALEHDDRAACLTSPRTEPGGRRK